MNDSDRLTADVYQQLQVIKLIVEGDNVRTTMLLSINH